MTLTDVQPRTRGHDAAGSDVSALPTIAGWSMVTPFGGTDETWRGLVGGRFIEDHTRLEVPESRDCPRAVALAHAAVDELNVRIPGDAALVVGTSKGSVESWMAGGSDPSGLADIAGRVGARLRLRGPRLTVSAACASGLHALIRASLMIRSGEARRVLVVAGEASVHPLFLASFQRLGVLPPAGFGCRPFDRDRRGFLMSEAAAAVLLEASDESDDCAEALYVDRCAFGGDAAHLTGNDPDARLLGSVLRRVIDGRGVDLFHAHGTGTEGNDATELSAIEREMRRGGRSVLFSHKGALGHSLGASGLLAVAINCMCHRNQTVPGNVRTTTPLPSASLAIDLVATPRTVRRSVVIASGFGGATAAVSLRSGGRT